MKKTYTVFAASWIVACILCCIMVVISGDQVEDVPALGHPVCCGHHHKVAYIYSIIDSTTGEPLSDVKCIISEDGFSTSPECKQVAWEDTNAFGQAVFMLEPRTYKMMMYKPGYTFENPSSIKVECDRVGVFDE